MKQLRTAWMAVAQGSETIFSDYEEGGDMWTGAGARERRRRVKFSDPFLMAPVVHVGLGLYDFDCTANIRADIGAENITPNGFDLVLRTWGDSRIARARGNWIAIGEVKTADDWDID